MLVGLPATNPGRVSSDAASEPPFSVVGISVVLIWMTVTVVGSPNPDVREARELLYAMLEVSDDRLVGCGWLVVPAACAVMAGLAVAVVERALLSLSVVVAVVMVAVLLGASIDNGRVHQRVLRALYPVPLAGKRPVKSGASGLLPKTSNSESAHASPSGPNFMTSKGISIPPSEPVEGAGYGNHCCREAEKPAMSVNCPVARMPPQWVLEMEEMALSIESHPLTFDRPICCLAVVENSAETSFLRGSIPMRAAPTSSSKAVMVHGHQEGSSV